MASLDEYPTQTLTGNDILALGKEAGARVLTMPEFPTQAELDAARDALAERAVELAYTQYADLTDS